MQSQGCLQQRRSTVIPKHAEQMVIFPVGRGHIRQHVTLLD